jgi:hypothetical protein
LRNCSDAVEARPAGSPYGGIPPYPRNELARVGTQTPAVENVAVPDDPLDIASMTREERDALKRELLRQHPELAEQYGLRPVR